jgi:hypothetical protein
MDNANKKAQNGSEASYVTLCFFIAALSEEQVKQCAFQLPLATY